jgi:hypothetical protein
MEFRTAKKSRHGNEGYPVLARQLFAILLLEEKRFPGFEREHCDA